MEAELNKAKEELKQLGDRVASLVVSDPEAGTVLIPQLLRVSDRIGRIIHVSHNAGI